MILSVTLIVDELHKGHRLVYRYPMECPVALAHIKEDWQYFYNQVSAITPDQFAKLFRAKPAMNNSCFELTLISISESP